MPIVIKSGSPSLLEPSGLVQACNGIALYNLLLLLLGADCSLCIMVLDVTQSTSSLQLGWSWQSNPCRATQNAWSFTFTPLPFFVIRCSSAVTVGTSALLAIFIYTITPGVPLYCVHRQVPYFAIGLTQIALRLYPYETEIFCQGYQLLLSFACCHQARNDTREVRVRWLVCWKELCVLDRTLCVGRNFVWAIKL